MPLNKSKGDMYPFVTHTWNAIKGKCHHGCSYCYMRSRFKQNKVRLDMKELRTNLGSNNFIFVGSSCDMWSSAIPNDWILPVLRHCREGNLNQGDWIEPILGKNYRYLFQSKNPLRFMDFIRNIDIDNYDKDLIPENTIFATTLESNQDHLSVPGGNIPPIDSRINGMCHVRDAGYPTMVSIEPIMKFDINEFIPMLTDISPEWITIGADSKGHKLPEPEPGEVVRLIEMLRKNYEVVIKSNLGRLLP